MKGKKTRTITLLILIAFALIVGCSHETPTPTNKNNTTQNNTTQNSNTQNNKPSTEENKDNAPSTGTGKEESQNSGTEEKEESIIVIPDWLSDKIYKMDNGYTIHFNDAGIPNIETDADLNIIATENGKVTYKVVDTEGNETTQYITSGDNGHSITIVIDNNEQTILYLDVDGPEWLKDKSFINLDDDPVKLEFNSRGLLATNIPNHSFTYIESINDISVDFVYIDETKSEKVHVIIEKQDNGDIKATMGKDSAIFEPYIQDSQYL